MDYRVGDEVLVKGKITDVSDRILVTIPVIGLRGFITIPIEESDISKPSTVIFDPTSPEAQALIGQEVESADRWDFMTGGNGILERIKKTQDYPFIVGCVSCKFIRPIPREIISREDAEAELEKALGKKVRIE